MHCYLAKLRLLKFVGSDMPHYSAPSPDEVALVKGAWINGVKVISRESKGVVVGIGDKKPELYQILDVLPFSSERKRSSAIVQCPDGTTC